MLYLYFLFFIVIINVRKEVLEHVFRFSEKVFKEETNNIIYNINDKKNVRKKNKILKDKETYQMISKKRRMKE